MIASDCRSCFSCSSSCCLWSATANASYDSRGSDRETAFYLENENVFYRESEIFSYLENDRGTDRVCGLENDDPYPDLPVCQTYRPSP